MVGISSIEIRKPTTAPLMRCSASSCGVVCSLPDRPRGARYGQVSSQLAAELPHYERADTRRALVLPFLFGRPSGGF